MAGRLDLPSPITSSKLSLRSSQSGVSSSSPCASPFKGSSLRLTKTSSAPSAPPTFAPLPPRALPPRLSLVSSSAVPRVVASAAAASPADFPAPGLGPGEPPFNINTEELQEELSRAFRCAKKQSKVALRKLADGTAGALRSAQSKVAEFERENDLRGKAREAVGAANERLEEVAFEAERHAFRFDAQFGVSSRVEEMKRTVVGAAYDADCNWRIRQRMRDVIKEIQYQLPKYLKRWGEFRTTPAGQLAMPFPYIRLTLPLLFPRQFIHNVWLLIPGWLARIFLWSLCILPLLPSFSQSLLLLFLVFPYIRLTLPLLFPRQFIVFAWLLISGWLAQIFLWSLCIVPLLPLLARALAKAAFVEGDCPSCGVRFIGPRRELLICRGCHHVVWTPKGWGSPRGAQSTASGSSSSTTSSGSSSSSSSDKSSSSRGKNRSARGTENAEVDIIDVVAISPAAA
ncbi:hypothetical protein CLOP_g19452 [Closterium sp. NIES-67]|nr:hypothetical protein CLOP_g19452 [Closterium sp. NIES-67]